MFEGETGLGGALGVDIQQLRRHVAHPLGRFLPRARPSVAAQFVQRRVFVRAAGVAADQMQRRNRHVQLVLTGVGEDQVFGLDAAGLQRGQADVAANAVLQVHHRLAGMQLRQVADQGIGVDGAPVVLPAAADALAEQIAFADQRPPAQAVEEAVFRGADHHVTARRFRLIEALNQRRRQLDAAEQILQRFTPPLALDGENYAAVEAFDKAPQVIQRGFMLRLHRQIGQGMVVQIGIAGLGRQLIGFQRDARPGLQLAEQRVDAQPQRIRRQQRAHRIDAAAFVTLVDVLPEALGGTLQIAGIDDQRVGRQVAEQRRQRLAEEQRLPVFDAGRPGAFADLLIDVFGVAAHLKLLAPLAAEQLDGVLVGGELVGRQQIDGLDFAQRALGIDVEDAQAVDFVIEKVDAVRLIAAHRVKIEQRAAGGEFAVFHHLIDAAIAGLFQLRAQLVARQALAFLHHQRVAVQELVRADALHQGIDRQNDHAARHGRQMIQARQTIRDDFLMRREAVIRQGFPVGQRGHHLVGELLDLVAQPQGVLHVRRDQHHRARVAFDDLGALHGAGRAGQLPQLAQIACAIGQRITRG